MKADENQISKLLNSKNEPQRYRQTRDNISELTDALFDDFYIFLLNEQLCIDYVNQTLLGELEHDLSFFIGKNFLTLPVNPLQDIGELSNHLNRRTRGLTVFDIEGRNHKRISIVAIIKPLKSSILIIGLPADSRLFTESYISKNRFNDFMNVWPEPIYIKDNSGCYRDCNAAFERDVMELPLEKFYGKRNEELNHFDPDETELDFYAKSDERVLSERLPYSYTKQVRTASGAVKYYRSVKMPIMHAGHLNGLVCSMTEISEEISVQEKLEKFSRRLTELVENTKDHIWFINSREELTFFNSNFKKFLKTNFDFDIDVNVKLTECRQLAGDKVWSSLASNALSDELPLREWQFSASEGDPTSYFEINANRIFDENNQLTGAHFTMSEVTERKNLINSLIESERSYKTLFDNMTIGYVHCRVLRDENRNIRDIIFLKANVAFCQLIRMPSSQIAGKFGSEILGEDLLPMLETLKLMYQSSTSQEVTHLFKSVSKFVRITSFVIEGDYFGATVEDATQTIRSREQIIVEKEYAENLSKFNGHIIAQLNQELRSPLNGILGFSTLLRTSKLNTDDREMVKIINSSAHKIEKTLNTVMSVTEFEHRVKSFEPRLVRLFDLIATQSAVRRSEATAKGLEIINEFDSAGAVVYSDERVLQVIIDQLIDNAIKFTKQGYVKVKVLPSRHQGCCADISVEDTGIGMQESYLTDVTTAFSQESSGYTRNYTGMGLGLTLVSKLTEFIDAKLEIESKKNEGSKITISLPMYDENDLI